MLVYTVISYIRIQKKVGEAALLKENTWICDNIDTPFILGIFNPRIYIPSTMCEQDMEYVIAHEKTCYRPRVEEMRFHYIMIVEALSYD